MKARTAASADDAQETVGVTVTGLPAATTLGDLEGLVLPKCHGRIVGVGLHGEGNAFIEFALLSDAEACLGEHELMGAKVHLTRPSANPPVLASAAGGGGGKRTRAASAEAVGGLSSATTTTPPPLSAREVSLTEPVLVTGSSSSDELNSALSSGYDGAALVVASTTSVDVGAVGVNGGGGGSDSGIITASLADDPLYVAQPPPGKKQRAETKKEKEKRLNRVGLSYRCGRCGQPKKGHVCIGEGGPIGAPDVAPPAAAAPLASMKMHSPSDGGGSDGLGGDAGPASRTPPSGGWDLDSESIFKDIKSVLQTPASAVIPAPGLGSGGGGRGGGVGGASGLDANGKVGGGAAGGGGGGKRRGSGVTTANMPPPVVAEKAAERSQLLEELDIAMQRPPSVITPDEHDNGSRGSAGAGPSSVGLAPSSLVSASDMFSPGQLMTHLLGTPTPAITPGLSPGTLNELGNMLQSPGAVLASARKAAEAAAEATGILETPNGQ